MKNILEFFKNPWVIGILTGVVSGIIVFFVTKLIVKRSEKAEYRQQVSNANLNVINALKPYIAERGLPSRVIFSSIINATARKYGVNAKDMYSIEICCEELIREIITDVYVSNEKKEEYTKSLSEYKNNVPDKSIELKLIDSRSYAGAYSDRMTNRVILLMSIMLGVLSMGLTIAFSIAPLNSFYAFENGIEQNAALIIISLLATMMVVLVSEVLLSNLKRKKRELIFEAAQMDEKKIKKEDPKSNEQNNINN